jgi:hypothetical protein
MIVIYSWNLKRATGTRAVIRVEPELIAEVLSDETSAYSGVITNMTALMGSMFAG